jgi:hypothetical protein
MDENLFIGFEYTYIFKNEAEGTLELKMNFGGVLQQFQRISKLWHEISTH